jgi:hypothetical protein
MLLACVSIPAVAQAEPFFVRAATVEAPDYYASIDELHAGPLESAGLSAESYETAPQDVPRGRLFRVVGLISEVYSTAFIEEVVFGYEGCCKRLAHIWQLDLEAIYDHFKLKGELSGFTLVDWESSRSFRFRLKGDLYRASELGGERIKIERLAAN